MNAEDRMGRLVSLLARQSDGSINKFVTDPSPDPAQVLQSGLGAGDESTPLGEYDDPQRHQDNHAAGAADAGLVLVQAVIQPLMAGGLDAPLAAARVEDLQRAEPVGWTAGDKVGAFGGHVVVAWVIRVASAAQGATLRIAWVAQAARRVPWPPAQLESVWA